MSAQASTMAVLLICFSGSLVAEFWNVPQKPRLRGQITDDPVTREEAIVALDGARAAASRATGKDIFTPTHYWFATKGLPE